jgi:anthranilate synthase component 2
LKVFILDNYDSFTYNLSHYVESLDVEVCVKLNDQFELSEIEAFDKIILSPGPGLPQDSGKLMEVIQHYHSKKPILGVCLGMQGIGAFFGEKLINLDTVKHGVQEVIHITSPSSIFHSINSPLPVGLYHSWAIQPFENNANIEITSKSEADVTMSIQHKKLPIYGVQFHPESILTPDGKKMIQNFLEVG